MQHKSVMFVVISLFVIGTLGLSYSTDAIAVPPEHSGNCLDVGDDVYECCWTETEAGDPEQIEIYLCQTCWNTNGVVDCSPPSPDPSASPTTGENIVPGDTGVLEQPPTPPSFDPTAPLQGGVLEQQQTPPSSGPWTFPGILGQFEQGSPDIGFLEQQKQQPLPADQGTAELPPPTTEETQPATVEEEQPVPVCQGDLEFNEDLGFCVPTECPEDQVLNEETGICVLEEPETAEEPEQQPEPEEIEQPEPEEQDQQQSSEEEGGSEDNDNN